MRDEIFPSPSRMGCFLLPFFIRVEREKQHVSNKSATKQKMSSVSICETNNADGGLCD